jgi:glutamyl/glutaminyl-tRNA synthetase
MSVSSSPDPFNPGRTRIAPTPSGFLHAGNAIDFLLADALAREQGLRMWLRIDDLDAGRARPEYLQDVFDSLHWLGIHWDEGPRDPLEHAQRWSQLRRLHRYHEVLQALREAGALYGCICTRSGSRGADGRYTGHCRDLGIDLDDPQAAWRLRVPAGRMVVVNGIAGEAFHADVHALMGDVVLRQRALEGGPPMPAYQVASLADDVDHAVTVIARGADLLPSTAVQLYLAELLGLHAFLNVRFLHHPLLLDDQGLKLSKTAGATSLKAMRERGEGPEEFIRQARKMYDELLRRG